MSRREFAWGFTGIAISGATFEPPLITERRVYNSGSTVPPSDILHRNGIVPVSVKQTQDGTVYLFAFKSPEARVQGWDRFNADDAWCAIRDAGTVALKEISVYPGGKIFEMSL